MVHSWMEEFIFRCTQMQITALTKHVSCQNYANNLIPSFLRLVVPLAQDFDCHSGSRRCNTGRSHSPSHSLCSPLQLELLNHPPGVSVSASKFRYDGIWCFCNLDHILLRLLCTDARVSTCPVSPYEAAPPSSHFWCHSLNSHVLLERQRPEPHSLLETANVRLLYRAKTAAKMSFRFCPGYLF